MIDINDIEKHRKAGESDRHRLEKQFQADALSYLGSAGMEAYGVTAQDLDKLTQRIDRAGTSFTPKSPLFISLLCGLLLGVSVFFVLYQKSQIHASKAMALNEESKTAPVASTSPSITDTTIELPRVEVKAYKEEHFASTREAPVPLPAVEVPESLPSHSIPARLDDGANEEELALKFVPNAPVVFIHNLKVTNYRLYYFRNDQKVELIDAEPGVSAQYSNQTERDAAGHNSLEPHYYLHQQLREAMLQFSKANYTGSIHTLKALLDYNAADANAQFYSGMSYYYLGNDARALEFFDKVLANTNNIFHQESAFYKAQVLVRTKQTEEAAVLLKSIIAERGFYSQRAAELLGKL